MNNGKICVSVCAETADEIIANIRRAEEFADCVEVRFDCLNPKEIDILLLQISNLKFAKLLLATFRSPNEGGKSTMTFEERVEFWQKEHDGFWAEDIEEDVLGIAKNINKKVVSFHDFNCIPDKLDDIYKRLSSSGSDIVKIAVQIDDITDTISVLKLIQLAKIDNQKIIPIAMGEAGKWTRILGLAHGAFMTYAALDAGMETADGQITAKDMIEIYRVRELDLKTKVYGVIGDPVSGSLSPYMHNPAFVAVGINAVFVPLLVEDLDEFMRRMVKEETWEVDLNFAGFSVTMPHKQAIMKYLDEIDPVAEKIGAVNTVKIEDGKLTGYNTDAYGFITPLKEKFGDLRDASVAVFGAGGAARACVYALKQEGADVTVFARDEHKTKAFADEFGVCLSTISKVKDQRSKVNLSNFDILVNATPLGMKGPLENESLFTAEQLKGVKFVYDLVMRLGDSPIILEAKKAGVAAIGGLEMLIGQGVRQFEIWTGREAPIEVMRRSVIARIER